MTTSPYPIFQAISESTSTPIQAPEPEMEPGRPLLPAFDPLGELWMLSKRFCSACPASGTPGRPRHLEYIELGAGDTGMLLFDLRRVTAELRRKET